jgi:CHAT domain-containing protein
MDVPLHLRAGDILHARADQQELDLSLSLRDSSDREVQGGDVFSANYVQGYVEQLVAAVPHEGDYTLRLQAAGPLASGTYRLSAAVAASTPRGRALAEGFGLLMDGLRLQRLGKQGDAIAKLDAAAARLSGADAPDLEAKAAQVSGGARFLSGDNAGAREVLERSLELARRAGPAQESDTLDVLARALLVAGELQQAIDASRRAVILSRQLGSPLHQATKVNTLAMVYREAGQAERALSYLLPAIEALDDRLAGPRAQLQVTAGNIHTRAGEAVKALPLLQAAADWYRRAGDRRMEAIALHGMGLAYLQLDSNAEAIDAFEASSRLERPPDNATALAFDAAYSAVAHRRLGRLDEAAGLLTHALEVGRAAGDTSLQLHCLVQMAQIELARGHHDEALRHVESAVDLSFATREGLRSPATRAGFLSSRAEILELRTDVLMALDAARPDGGYAARAFTALNDVKARGLTEMVVRGTPTASSDRERELEIEINRLERERSSARPSDLRAAAELGRQINELLVELEAAREPAQRPLSLPGRGTFTVEAVRALLDPGTALVQYGYGRQKIYGWLITREEFRSFAVGERDAVDERARRAYSLLVARADQGRGQPADERRQSLERADREAESLLADLGGLLLGPARTRLDAQRLAVVAEGALQYLPFAALTLDSGREAPQSADREIVYLPSVAVLHALRARGARRGPARHTIALFADPVFSADDARVRGAESRPSAEPDDVMRSAEESGVQQLSRLRFSRHEADAIAAVAPAAGTMKALDFAASRPSLREAVSGRYRILHFATHGLVNHVHPDLSGLVLSLVDPLGVPQDGFFRLHEIYGLQLDAELVTLSACRTAFGRELRGEGLAGLSQGFLAAGATRVLASLWNVDDRATAELMKHFYAALVRDNRPATAALRKAQSELRKSPRWRSPYYWAGFVLQGDWR